MNIKVGDIKSFTLITGMEIIGKVSEIGEQRFSISKAYGVQVQPRTDESGNPSGVSVSLGPLSPFAMAEDKSGAMDIELYFSTILLATNPPEQLIAQYCTQTGSIVMPPEKKVKLAN